MMGIPESLFIRSIDIECHIFSVAEPVFKHILETPYLLLKDFPGIHTVLTRDPAVGSPVRIVCICEIGPYIEALQRMHRDFSRI